MRRSRFLLVLASVAFAAACSNKHGTSGTGGTKPVGIGTPSNVYPAPHPDPPTVMNLGGPTFAAPKLQPIFFAGDDATTQMALTSFMSQLGATSYWHATTSEYGVGAPTMLPPIVLAETVSSPIDNTQIQTWLAGKLNGNDPAFPPADGSTAYLIAYPPGVSVTFNGNGWLSCYDINSWHDQVQLDAAHNKTEAPFIVLPRCPAIYKSFGLSGVDLLTNALSHEWIETATDPFIDTTPAFATVDQPHQFYQSVFGLELGDLCDLPPDAKPTTTLPGVGVAQRTWSNAAALAGHDPCVPAPAGPYFNAVPVLTDTLALGSGVKIPAGQSKTIDVKLFSDASTGGPFIVSAQELSAFGAGASLGFSFDEDAGQNGQTLHLTITVSQPGPSNVELFRLRSILNGRANYWIGLVGN